MADETRFPKNQLSIAETKITRYLLLELPKDDKSKFLAQANYTLENWQALKDDLIQLAQTNKADYISTTSYGMKYKIRGELRGLKVITIWMVVDDHAKFVTLIPDKGAK